MAETYEYIFMCTESHIRSAEGIYNCYAESDFVYDLGMDNGDIKTKVMGPLHELMDAMLRGTIDGAFNQAVKLAKEKNIEEIEKLFAAGERFFYICLDRGDVDKIKKHIIEHCSVPNLDEYQIEVATC